MKLISFLILLIGQNLIAETKQYNVLFVISHDLTSTALGCLGNKVCKTPYIDELAKEGALFTRAYCQATYCDSSRASLMFGYYRASDRGNRICQRAV